MGGENCAEKHGPNCPIKCPIKVPHQLVTTIAVSSLVLGLGKQKIDGSERGTRTPDQRIMISAFELYAARLLRIGTTFRPPMTLLGCVGPAKSQRAHLSNTSRFSLL